MRVVFHGNILLPCSMDQKKRKLPKRVVSLEDYKELDEKEIEEIQKEEYEDDGFVVHDEGDENEARALLKRYLANARRQRCMRKIAYVKARTRSRPLEKQLSSQIE